MALVQRMLFVLLVVGVVFSALGQVQPPNTGKMSWDLYQTVATGARKRAVGEEVPTITALLITKSPITVDDLSQLQNQGYEVVGALGQFVLVKAPADYYSDPQNGVDVIDFVSNATLPPSTITGQASPITNGTGVIGAQAVWATGHRGEGVKIAIIDVGFDLNNPSLAQLNPTSVAIRPTSEGVGTYQATVGEVAQKSSHGTSCAVIAGDVAPDATLYLLSYPIGTEPIGWLDALDYAVHTLGVDVVSTSVEFGYPTCHADGTGLLNELVDQILDGASTELVIAAGNWAEGSGSDRTYYAGTFQDSDGDYQYDFTAGTDDAWDRNTLRFSAHEGDEVVIILEWDDWQSEVKGTDLDLILYDADYHVPLSVSQAQQFGNPSNPVEIIRGKLPYTGDYCITVIDHAARWNNQPEQAISFHLNMFNASGSFPYIEHHTVCGSVRGVATNPRAIAVGAVSVEDGTLRLYSSRGPTTDGRPKPDLYAPDGVTGTVYDRFYGTSAAAPYAAGAIALLRSYTRQLSLDDIVHILQKISSSMDECSNPVHIIDLARTLKGLGT